MLDRLHDVARCQARDLNALLEVLYCSCCQRMQTICDLATVCMQLFFLTQISVIFASLSTHSTAEQ